MNKTELIAAVAEKANLDKKSAKAAVEAAIEAVKAAVAEGDKVQITGFATLEVKERAARTCRNPKTGEAMEVAASKYVAFKAGSELKASAK